ncbi:MAG TPA: zinc finger Ran-binding domain-containing protein [Actinomycetota bacterium]|nr:zinc finger Ran-binding domain-containing protein [Actinomycetota bacterium]
MVADRRCPRCGALVAEDAEWCGQCYASLVEPSPARREAAPASREATDPRAATWGGRAAAEAPPSMAGTPPPMPGQPQPPHAPQDEAFPTGAGASAADARWPCPVCQHQNPIHLDACEVCGTPFARLFQEQERPPEVEPGTAALWSALFPGLGHWRCGRTLDGVARAVIFAWTFGTLLILILSRIGKGGLGATLPLFALFLASSVAVWMSAVLDAYRIAAGADPVVSSRTLLWGSVVLIVVSVLLASLVTLPAVRGG